jgi:hypothetical protein
MRRTLSLIALLLATAACGQSEPQQSASPLRVNEMPAVQYEPAPPAVVTDAAPAERSAIATQPPPPDIAPTAAPGVAFNYRYAFRLAAPRIAAMQEAHAAACERLTVARCRITGMLYRLTEPGRIEARLELKLDPAIARRFGRESGAAVARAGGLLTQSEISGVDAGGAIQAAGRSIADLTAELNRIEGRLRALRADAPERPQLEYQADQTRTRIATVRDSRDAQQESLATTPMVFEYAAADGAPATFGERPTVAEAARNAGDNFLGGVTILLIVLVTLLPWALAALAAWAGFRFARRRWFPNRPESEA